MRKDFERALSKYFLVGLTTQIAAILLTTLAALLVWDQFRSTQLKQAVSTAIEAQRAAISENLFVSEVLGIKTSKKAPALRLVEETLASQGFLGATQVIACDPSRPEKGLYAFSVGERRLALCVRFVASSLSWSAVLAVVAAIGLACLLIAVVSWRLLRGRISERVLEPIMNRMERGARLSALGELAAQVSHDIRSPLAALKVLASHLEGDPDVKELASATVTRLEDIANDLLQAKASAPAQSVKIEPILNSLLTEKSAEHHRQFNLNSPARNNLTVRVEPVSLTRVLSNLLNNAVEASPQDSPVDLTVSRSRSFVSLTVRDRGRGFPEKVLARLETGDFESTKTNGNGLGLRSAYLFAAQNGGRLELRNRRGSGAEATICLPLGG